MPIISLADPSIYNNNVQRPTDGEKLRTDLLTIIAESNAQHTRINALENLAMTIAGAKTFTGTMRVDTINERTTDNGTVINGVRLKGRAIWIDREGADPVTIRYNFDTNQWELTNDGDSYQNVVVSGGDSNQPQIVSGLLIRAGLAALKRTMIGLEVDYVDANRIRIRPGWCTSSDGQQIIEVTSEITVDLTVSGLNGLDTGSEAANMWYYVYVVYNEEDNLVGAVFSTVNEWATGSITLPAGYTKKRQLPIGIRNQSGDIIPFAVWAGWPYHPTIRYINGMDSNTEVLIAGTSIAFSAVNLSSFVPPFSKSAVLYYHVLYTSAGRNLILRPTGSGLTNGITINSSSSGVVANRGVLDDVPTNASQSIDYRFNASGANATLYVFGYTVTEM